MKRFICILSIAAMFLSINVGYSSDVAPTTKTELFDNDVGVFTPAYVPEVYTIIPTTAFEVGIEGGWLWEPIIYAGLETKIEKPDFYAPTKRKNTELNGLDPYGKKVSEVDKTLPIYTSGTIGKYEL